MITIRRVRSEDWKMLKELRLRALVDAPYAFAETAADKRQAPDSQWQSLAARSSEGNSSTSVVAFDGRNAIGMAASFFGGDNAAQAHLVAMWVAEEYRGTRVAACILGDVVAWARTAGATEIDAGITTDNVRARRFYEKQGFKEAGTRAIDAAHLEGCEHVMVMNLE